MHIYIETHDYTHISTYHQYIPVYSVFHPICKDSILLPHGLEVMGMNSDFFLHQAIWFTSCFWCYYHCALVGWISLVSKGAALNWTEHEHRNMGTQNKPSAQGKAFSLTEWWTPQRLLHLCQMVCHHHHQLLMPAVEQNKQKCWFMFW